MSIECSQTAYEKLQSAGIEGRLGSAADDLREALTGRNIWRKKLGALVEDSGRDVHQTGMSSEFYNDVRQLDARFRNDDLCLDLVRKGLPDHPFLLGGLLFGEELGRFQEYGFETEGDFAEAVTAYCVGERDSSRSASRAHIWRNNDKKNRIDLIDHGDVTVSQTDVSGDSYMLRDPQSSGFGWKQDASSFFAIVLKYTGHYGMQSCDEMRDWEDLVDKWSNPWGQGHRDWVDGGREVSYEAKNLLDSNFLHGSGSGMNRSPHRIERDASAVWARVRGLELEFIAKSRGDGLAPWQEAGDSRVVATYAQEDVPDLLTGAYKTFARNRTFMCEMLSHFREGVESLSRRRAATSKSP